MGLHPAIANTFKFQGIHFAVNKVIDFIDLCIPGGIRSLVKFGQNSLSLLYHL